MKPRVLSREDCESLLSRERYGRLALSLGDVPYIVPMSYVYSGGRIYLHSRGSGRKIELVRKNPRVCFEVDHLETNRWSSVVITGKADLSSEMEAKMRMFDAFVGKDLKGHGGKQFGREDLEKMEMTIWEIEIEEMTGREGMW
ncbi:MAG: Pyridoxamine 5'-phosphate oxidase [Methanosaeta sp. PtaU1.Bin060]|jgi:nitroimidazol reductase NimA-like FMN-containing flavoprotein (pyridoxamine 5'-phosphate oxidase superfamily)|nr:MAG: Pyridoxamine 5'-phosphate oxidase [Methanosaeta sp. PtaU1.Bin060]